MGEPNKTYQIITQLTAEALPLYEKREKIDFEVDKTILIVGGSQGLGFEAAKQLQEKGAKTIITSRTQSSAEKVAGDLNKLGYKQKAEGIAMDVTNFDSIDKGFADLTSKFGEIDVVLLSAGVGSFNPQSKEDFDKCQKVNVHGAIHVAEKAKDALKQGGRIVVVSAGFAIHQAIPKFYVEKIDKATSIHDSIFKELPYDTSDTEVAFWVYALSKGIINKYVELAAKDQFYQSKAIELVTCDPSGTKTALNNFSEHVPFEAWQGAQALVWPVAAKEVTNGEFYLYGHPVDVKRKLI